MQAYNEAQR